MKQTVHIIRKVDFEKQYIQGLKLELDYELLNLHQAIQNRDEKERSRANKRLSEIHMELEAFHAFA